MPPRPPPAAAAAVARPDRLRKGIMAGAVAAVVIVGSLTGAQLKQDKQKSEAIKQFRAVNPLDQIAMLETQKKVLVEQLGTMQRKVDAFKERVAEREEERRREKERR